MNPMNCGRAGLAFALQSLAGKETTMHYHHKDRSEPTLAGAVVSKVVAALPQPLPAQALKKKMVDEVENGNLFGLDRNVRRIQTFFSAIGRV